ncbi:hypothetical protein EJ08DRAFT_70186 [Tothia fuscella]|uniref:Uncharacterized protein n=1 Tax=Tothia fuscella TaxID=1048955 RepID=A0A9P4NEX3_9PEZI|nr:hypothetical protein EJ08DRAFT_70186 [Tothia fuscella]
MIEWGTISLVISLIHPGSRELFFLGVLHILLLSLLLQYFANIIIDYLDSIVSQSLDSGFALAQIGSRLSHFFSVLKFVERYLELFSEFRVVTVNSPTQVLSKLDLITWFICCAS